MDFQQYFGKGLILIGSLCIAVGVALCCYRFFPFFGKLPGDIRIETPHLKLYFPIATCLLISALLSGILFLLSRFH